MTKNNDKVGEEEMAKLFDVMNNPLDTSSSGFVPIPITCPKCGNYKNNTRVGIDVKASKMPQRKLYTCSKCKELFNDPPQ